MIRAVKFKLKNGKIITIRPLRLADYDAQESYIKKFSKGPGAIQTLQYPGRPRPPKENFQKFLANNFLLGAFDGDTIIGTCSVNLLRHDHPYSGHAAGMGMSVLQKYTHNGIGGKFFEIGEKWARENGVHKLQAEIRHNNIPSIANCIKHGFIITGINYDAAFINGKWVHEYIVEKVLDK